MDLKWKPMWHVEHWREGGLLWENWMGANMLHDEGEQFMLEVVFTEVQVPPVNYYFGLDQRAGTSAEANTLASLVAEPTGANGYYRQPIPSANTSWLVAQIGGDYRASSSQGTFAALAAGWGPVDTGFVGTSSNGTGKLIATVSLGASRTLIAGDSLNLSMYISLGE